MQQYHIKTTLVQPLILDMISKWLSWMILVNVTYKGRKQQTPKSFNAAKHKGNRSLLREVRYLYPNMVATGFSVWENIF